VFVAIDCEPAEALFTTARKPDYRDHYPLTDAARGREHLNPGNGSVSRLCHEPRVALAVLRDWLAPWLSGPQLTLLAEHRPVKADVTGDTVRTVTVRSLRSGRERVLAAPYFLDASELGDLLPLTGTEFVTGAEAQAQTNELHALDQADPDNQQAFTMCSTPCGSSAHRTTSTKLRPSWWISNAIWKVKASRSAGRKTSLQPVRIVGEMRERQGASRRFQTVQNTGG
jgi:hypothetical protein